MEIKMKLCTKCNKLKPFDEFNKRSGVKDGLQPNCRICSNERFKKWALENKDRLSKKRKESRKQTRLEQQQKIWNYLKDRCCVDCFESRLPCLDFDHVRGKKLRNISEMCGRYSWNTIEAEIKKCEIRCANCHRIRTAKKQDWYKNL
jgi:hypothetical protein